MSAQLAQLQEDRAQYQEQLDLVLASLNDDPGNDELLALKAELQSALEIIDDSMSELKPEATTTKEAKADSQKTADPAPPHDDTPVVYKVNESILARWVTGDKAFYPARIMSVTGSATAPMYTVKFKSYDTIETLRARDIRPVQPAGGASSSTKRKADGSTVEAAHKPATPAVSTSTSTPTPPPPPSSASASAPALPQPPQPSHSYGQPPPPPPPSAPAPPSQSVPAPPVSTAIPPPPPSRFRTIDRFSQGVVSSASPQIYAQPPQQSQNSQQQYSGAAVKNNSVPSSNAHATPLGEEPPVKKFKKIKATKQLEAGKSKWQEFSSKGKTGKSGTKKDSMFRTPDGPQGRVGFIGSGQAMRKDVTRSRHIYQTNDDVD